MDIKEYYENYDEDNRLLSRYGLVEYITTMKYIKKYLTTNARIIEIGAGTGRYSHTLANKGYRVDAVELLEHNINIFNANTKDGEKITITQGNATDLNMFKDNAYDITLLLGPMYHLHTKEEQLQALSEAVRVTKKGGIIMTAYCMADAAILSYGFVRNMIDEIINDCKLDVNSFDNFEKPWGIFQLYRTEDIISLRNRLNVKPLHLISADGYANHMREKINKMSDEKFELYLKYHLAVCERKDMIGLSHHTLDVFRKV